MQKDYTENPPNDHQPSPPVSSTPTANDSSDKAADASRPVIQIKTAQYEVNTQAIQALAKKGDFFQRAGRLVRLAPPFARPALLMSIHSAARGAP